MINRLLIRIKVVQLVYAHIESHTPIDEADSELMASLEASFKLYSYLLALIVKVTEYRAAQIEAGRKKYFPTEEERNPNTRFADNRVAGFLRDRSNVVNYCDEHGLLSDFDTDLYRSVMERIEQTPVYMAYMSQPETPTFDQDKALWRELLNTVIPDCPVLDTALEGKNIYWNDDLTTVLTYVVKAVGRISEDDEQMASPRLFKSEEDKQFARQLYRAALDGLADNISRIDAVATNWEADRMMLMDKVVMATCIAEVRAFPDLPTRISLNEYIEMAKHYCSPNSARFVNGILDKVVKQLRAENAIFKD